MAQTSLTGTAAAAVPSTAANKRVKFIVSGLIIVAAMAYLIYSALGTTGQYYLTIGELKTRGVNMVGRPVRVSGKVVTDSIDWNSPELILKFSVADDSGTLPIVFHGPKPDNMDREGSEAIIEGKLTADGSFQANNLLLKCPSRYEEVKPVEVKAIQ